MMNRRTFMLALPLLPALLYPTALQKSYPNFETVFKEFDIQASYIENPDFMKFVTLNEEKYRRFYKNSLKRGAAYIPMFKQLLISQGLSDLFIYMSMTESGFQTYAKSSAHAAGLWQFMSATARRFNLKVDGKVDERFDPVASTEAASKYIRALYSMFGKWYLVMMAYNCGEGRLARAIKKAHSDDFSLLMDNDRKYIPPETRTYLKKIILLSMMGERIVKSETKESIEIKKEIIDGKILVNISGGTNLLKFIDMIHLGIGEFFEMNPQLSDYKISEDIAMVQVSIPADRFEQYQAFYTPPTLEQIFKIKHYTNLISHIVAKGDTLKTISRKYRTTPIDLIIANRLSTEKLKLGKLLAVPVTKKIFESMIKY